jgi:hypothetical protein
MRAFPTGRISPHDEFETPFAGTLFVEPDYFAGIFPDSSRMASGVTF